MTFDPVLPPVALAALASVILALRAVALRSAARSGRWGVLRWAATTGALMLVVLAAARPGVDAERTADDAGAAGAKLPKPRARASPMQFNPHFQPHYALARKHPVLYVQ